MFEEKGDELAIPLMEPASINSLTVAGTPGEIDIEANGIDGRTPESHYFTPLALEPDEDFVAWPCCRPLVVGLLFLFSMLPFLIGQTKSSDHCVPVHQSPWLFCEDTNSRINARVILSVVFLLSWLLLIVVGAVKARPLTGLPAKSRLAFRIEAGLGLESLAIDTPASVAPWFSVFFVVACVYTMVVTIAITMSTKCLLIGNGMQTRCKHGSRSLEWATLPAFGSLSSHSLLMLFRVSNLHPTFSAWTRFMASSCASPDDATSMLMAAKRAYHSTAQNYACTWLTDKCLTGRRRREWAMGPFTLAGVLFGLVFDFGILGLVSSSKEDDQVSATVPAYVSMWKNIVHLDPLGHRVLFWTGMVICAVNNYALVRYLLGSSVASVFGIKAALDTVVKPTNSVLCRVTSTTPLTVRDVQTWLTGRRMVVVWVKQVVFPRFSRVILALLLTALLAGGITVKTYFTKRSSYSSHEALAILAGNFGDVELIAYFFAFSIIAVIILFACTQVWDAMLLHHSTMNVLALSPHVTPKASTLLREVTQFLRHTDAAPTVARVPADMKLLVAMTITLTSAAGSIAFEHL